MKKIAILFVVFFCSVSLWAQTIEDDATWKLKTDTVRALKHYKAGDNWFIGIQVAPIIRCPRTAASDLSAP